MTLQTTSIEPAAQPFQDDQAIAKAQTQVIKRMKSEPEIALGRLSTKGRVTEGLACTIEQGKYSAVLDLAPSMGGMTAGPSPSFFARAAIAGCVAIAIKMNAAREGLEFRSVEVEVTTEMDGAALMGLGKNSAAPLETCVDIEIDTDEDRSVVEALVAEVLERDPWFLALRDPQVVLPKVSLKRAV